MVAQVQGPRQRLKLYYCNDSHWRIAPITSLSALASRFAPGHVALKQRVESTMSMGGDILDEQRGCIYGWIAGLSFSTVHLTPTLP